MNSCTISEESTNMTVDVVIDQVYNPNSVEFHANLSHPCGLGEILITYDPKNTKITNENITPIN
ncbi:hypothetical protein GF327_03210, partial [Candidatus Woesearchaeota archaeon]|nr:hypothetical protein [Candidatus Woesearchaeota archaeon]